jgi:hypothetical protein
MSLKLALERLLGRPCYHMVEVFPRPAHFGLWTAAAHGDPVDWPALFDGFAAAVDWPASAFWEDLSHAYPDAIIILSSRDSASWWKSASETIFAGRPPPGSPMAGMLEAVIGGRFTRSRDRETAIAAYEQHNAHVRATAPRARLVDWTMTDGWAPLCAALGTAIPDEPFPHANTTEEFKARVTVLRESPH